MAARIFSCSNCNEEFHINLPEDTTRAGYERCDDKDTTYHNLERTIQCQNCEDGTTIYYCTDEHPPIAFEND